jgi:hypothetical protein
MKAFNKPSDGQWASNHISSFVRQNKNLNIKQELEVQSTGYERGKIFINSFKAPKTYPYQRLPVVYPAMVSYQS